MTYQVAQHMPHTPYSLVGVGLPQGIIHQKHSHKKFIEKKIKIL
jgi:hypothetical protein